MPGRGIMAVEFSCLTYLSSVTTVAFPWCQAEILCEPAQPEQVIRACRQRTVESFPVLLDVLGRPQSQLSQPETTISYPRRDSSSPPASWFYRMRELDVAKPRLAGSFYFGGVGRAGDFVQVRVLVAAAP